MAETKLFDFESGIMPPELHGSWIISTDSPQSGSYCIKNQYKNLKGISTQAIRFNIATSGTISFWYKIAATYASYFRVYIDGTRSISTASTTAGWVQYTSGNLAAGEHVVTFGHFGDNGSISDTYITTLYVDNIQITDYLPWTDAGDAWTEDFEDDTFTYSMMSNNGNWSRDTMNSLSGTYSFKANGFLPVTETAEILLKVWLDAPSTLSFWALLGMHGNAGLLVGINGSGTLYSGNDTGWKKYSFNLSAGENIITIASWSKLYGSSWNDFGSQIYIDDLRIPNAIPIPAPAVTGTIENFEDESNVFNIQGTREYNTSFRYSGTRSLNLRTPTQGANKDTSLKSYIIRTYLSADGEMTAYIRAQLGSMNELRVYVDGTEVKKVIDFKGWCKLTVPLTAGEHIIEFEGYEPFSDSNNRYLQTCIDELRITNVVPIPEDTRPNLTIEDFEDDIYNIPLIQYNFERVSGYSIDGSSSIKSLRGSNTKELVSRIYLSEAGELSFDYKISASQYKYTHFFIDGIRQWQKGGRLGWQKHTSQLAAGEHILTWNVESYTTAEALDAILIDNLMVTNLAELPAPIGTIEDFEDAEIVFPFMGSYTVATSDPRISGTGSLKISGVTAGTERIITLDVYIGESGGEISFYMSNCSYRTTNNYNPFEFYIDNVLKATKHAGEGGWQKYTLPLTKNNHNLKWRFNKAYTDSQSLDAVFIDNIIISGITEQVITRRMVVFI